MTVISLTISIVIGDFCSVKYIFKDKDDWDYEYFSVGLGRQLSVSCTLEGIIAGDNRAFRAICTGSGFFETMDGKNVSNLEKTFNCPKKSHKIYYQISGIKNITVYNFDTNDPCKASLSKNFVIDNPAFFENLCVGWVENMLWGCKIV